MEKKTVIIVIKSDERQLLTEGQRTVLVLEKLKSKNKTFSDVLLHNGTKEKGNMSIPVSLVGLSPK